MLLTYAMIVVAAIINLAIGAPVDIKRSPADNDMINHSARYAQWRY